MNRKKAGSGVRGASVGGGFFVRSGVAPAGSPGVEEAEALVERELTCRTLSVRAASVNEAQRTVDAVLATENAVTVFDWRSYEPIDEVLLMSGARFPSQMPLLESHNRYSLDYHIGSVRDIRVEGGQLVGRLHFAEGDDRAERAWNKVRQGHITDVSIGYRVDDGGYTDIEPGASAVVSGRTFTAGKRRMRVSSGWAGHETSVVPIGADAFSKMRGAANASPAGGNGANRETKTMNAALKRFLLGLMRRSEATDGELQAHYEGLTGEQRAMADALKGGVMRESEVPGLLERYAPAPTPVPTPTPAPTPQRAEPVDSVEPVDPAAIREAALREERERVANIQELGGDDVSPDLIRQAIRDNWPVDRARAAVLEHIRSGRPGAVGPNIITRDSDAGRSFDAIAAGLELRCGLESRMYNRNASAEERAEATRRLEQGARYRSWTLREMCREALMLEGRSVPHDAEDMIRAALSSLNVATIFTTSVNAMVLKSYEEAGDTTRPWTQTRPVADFKFQERHNVGKIGDLEILGPGGEAKHGDYSAGVETYKIARFAKQVVLDEQDIINDSLHILTELPTKMGRSAARIRQNLVYAILLSNPQLQDSVALFDASGHANLQTTGSALAAGTLQAAITAMGKQTETTDAGDVIHDNLKPTHLIVPPDLKFLGDQLLHSAERYNASENGNKNVLLGENITLISENRVGVAGVTDPVTGTTYAGTATNYFLVSADANTIEVGLLNGKDAPTIRRFNLEQGRWGIGWDIKHDIGAKALDYKGLNKSTGAA